MHIILQFIAQPGLLLPTHGVVAIVEAAVQDTGRKEVTVPQLHLVLPNIPVEHAILLLLIAYHALLVLIEFPVRIVVVLLVILM
jgi:hypothetical protein